VLLLLHPLTTECSGTVSSTFSTCNTRRVTHVTVPCSRVTPAVLLLLHPLTIECSGTVSSNLSTCHPRHVTHVYSTLFTCYTRRVTLVTIPCPRVTPDVLLLLHPLTTESSGTVSSTFSTFHTRRVTLVIPTNNRVFRHGK
jgi:hypothetical protein